jgi:hypothetical protein
LYSDYSLIRQVDFFYSYVCSVDFPPRPVKEAVLRNGLNMHVKERKDTATCDDPATAGPSSAYYYPVYQYIAHNDIYMNDHFFLTASSKLLTGCRPLPPPAPAPAIMVAMSANGSLLSEICWFLNRFLVSFTSAALLQLR